jgi:hypothetical protein
MLRDGGTRAHRGTATHRVIRITFLMERNLSAIMPQKGVAIIVIIELRALTAPTWAAE